MEIRKITNPSDEQALLTIELARANDAYRHTLPLLMDDHEYDEKLEQLEEMERKAGFKYDISPTGKVGAKVVSELVKVVFEKPCLSLDKEKYKNRKNIVKWIKDNKDDAVEMLKNDGLTLCLFYEDGELKMALTRGDGIEGCDVTHNAEFFKGIPKKISYKGRLVVRGEAVMKFAEFERVNALTGGIYANARNLASATVQMLDANESRKREIQFIAFELVEPEPVIGLFESSSIPMRTEPYNLQYMQDRLDFLQELGFEVVRHERVTSENVLDSIEDWKQIVSEELDYPTDGLVYACNDMVYGMSLGNTGHHFRHSIALKWTDATQPAVIEEVEWSVGKTGIITPVAIFTPVKLGIGSTVTRASLHNLSIMKNMPTPDGKHEAIRIGAKAEVYLANMIIPQIATIQNSFDGGLTCPTQPVNIPDVCPVCGRPTRIENRNGIEVLHCDNEACAARQVGNLMNTFGKDGLFIKGLGESQIEDLMEAGLVDATPLSFYQMANEDRANSVYPKESEFAKKVSALWAKDGWGQKKWDNLVSAIENSRKTTLQKFLYSLNIPLLGNDMSKKLSKFWNGDINKFIEFIERTDEGSGGNDAYGQERAMRMLMSIDGVGEEKARNIVDWAVKMWCTPIEGKNTNTANLRDELNETLRGDCAADYISKGDWMEYIDDFDTWAETAKAGDTYYYGGYKYKCEAEMTSRWEEEIIPLIEELVFPVTEENASDNSLEGLTFVITGTVHDYKNRDEFKESVEARGGKVAGSVSKKSSFLVSNESSDSSKYKKAMELSIPVLTEDEFIARFGR